MEILITGGNGLLGNWYAIGRARSELGYRPAVDLRDGVALTAAWYVRYAPFRDGTEQMTQPAQAAPASSEAAEG